VQQPPTAWEALTPAEAKVAILAARGSPNALIAQELVVSCRTVETHLQRTYAKLGIRSRTQLAPFVRSDEKPRT
jgi:DNA-binding NarL/FixJ family response regulator